MKTNSNNQKTNKERETDLSGENSSRQKSPEKIKNKLYKDAVKDEDFSITNQKRHKQTEKVSGRINSKKNAPDMEEKEQKSELSDSYSLLF